ncbi:pilus assembly protein [Endozoicomonas arenosclerae]|uniref:pilus assembly protein n=1 Tax=Endozoicomonas arenosclerae TaxID=1633495 RepID=UPI000AC9E871|nr:PilC/PilY family type IV pilus protein [Endozoicomonas arenosclerae]
MKFRSINVTLLTSILLTSSTATWSDDTDIFLSNPNYDSSIKPNVLFVLDNSGSMNWALTRNSDAQNGEDSRMDVMQESFSDILGNASNINAGLMKLHARSGESSRLTFPVTDIDSPYGSNILLDGTPTLLESNDDAQESLSEQSVNTTSEKLTIGLTEIPGTSSQEINSTIQFPVDNAEGVTNSGHFWYNTSYLSMYQHPEYGYQTNALYFRNLGIPSTATIEEAKIIFRAAETNHQAATVSISAEKSKSAQPLDQVVLSSRNKTNSVTWNIEQWSNDTSYDTVDISAIIQAVVDDSSLNWTPEEELNNLALFFETVEGDRQAYKNNSSTSSSRHPKLYIKYSIQSQEIDSLVGVRFQTVGVPQGSTISSASLQFTAAENDNSPITIEVQAGRPENNNNNSFSNSDSNLSNRSMFDPIDWLPGPWAIGTPESPNQYSVNVTSLFQQVVNDSNWCGNESATFYLKRKENSPEGKRVAHSFDGETSKKARLVVEYTPSPNGGCRNEIINTRIQSNNFDAYERLSGSNRNRVYLYNSVYVSTSRMAALHYPGLQLRKDATILSAHLELTASHNRNGSASIEIRAEDTDSSLAIASQNRNITNRSGNGVWTTASTAWTINEDWQQYTTYRSPDIKDVIEEVIDRDGWSAGNNLTLLLKMTTGSERIFVSHDDNPTFSARLILKVASGGVDQSSGYKVKDHLISLVNNMYSDGGTPIVPTYYEAAQYFRGNNSPIVNSCQFNHFVLLTDGQANSNTQSAVNGIASLTGENCYYDSNIDGERCGRTLSDWLENTDLKSNIDDKNNVTTHTIAFATQADNTAKSFMEDIAAEGEGGFYTPSNAQELSDAFNKIINEINEKESTFAAPGVAANSFNQSQHLNKIFYSVFKPSLTDRWIGNLKKYQLLENSTSGVTEIHDSSEPAVPAIDSSTGFFNESSQSFWSATQDGNNVDQGGAASRLKNANDRKIFTYVGNSPAGNAVSITSDNRLLKTTNTALTPDLFGLSSNNVSRKNDLINWARNPNTWMGDPLHSTPALVNYRCRNQTEQNLFQCSEDNLELALFIGSNDGMFHAFDTNPASGEELNMEYFSYIPQELLPILDTLEKNESTSRVVGQQGRPYGLDGDITVWVNDKNGNGVIYGGADTLDYDNDSSTKLIPEDTLNPGEFVYAYIGMRRGGRNYYALDVTDLSNPKMLWFIRGGEGDFSRLGQTWSKPIKTQIRIGKTPNSSADTKLSSSFTEVLDVLVFSGGYDNSQDSSPTYQSDSMGNALYIVNASTGELLWSASTDSSSSLQLNKMQYSIPGGVSLADLQGDGYPDQILFGDTGGQLWRLYINQCIPISDSNGDYSNDHCAVTSRNELSNLVWPSDSDGSGTWDADDGVMAYLGYPTVQGTSPLAQSQNARKFYTRPDITTFGRNGRLNIGIAIGSGKRSDPLGRINQHTEDRFFFITSQELYNPSFSPDGSSDNHKSKLSVPSHTMYDVNNSDLVEVGYSQNSDGDYVTSIPSGSDTLENGWYLKMSTLPGLHEKVMSDPTIYNSTIYFSSFTPEADATNTCSAVTGRSYSWEVKLDGEIIERRRINTNGIVDASVFIRLADGGTPGDGTPGGGTPGGGTPGGGTPGGGTPGGETPGGGSTCLMFNGTDGKEVSCPDFEGSSYWRQVR